MYDPKLKKKRRKASVAAIIVEMIRPGTNSRTKVEIYSTTYRRKGGNEYDLGEAMTETIARAVKLFGESPKSAIVWRDGISEGAFTRGAADEIAGIRKGLAGAGPVGTKKAKQPSDDVPLTYIVCQKRIATKLLTMGVQGFEDGKYGAPPGTLVKSIQGLEHQTFYINGRAPPVRLRDRYLRCLSSKRARAATITSLVFSLTPIVFCLHTVLHTETGQIHCDRKR